MWRAPQTFFRTPSAFIFLYENQSFLAFKDSSVSVWNFAGELMRTFDDHRLCFPIPDIDHTSVIYITHAQDIIISLCEDNASSTDDADRGGGVGDGGPGGSASYGVGGSGGLQPLPAPSMGQAAALLSTPASSGPASVSIHVSNVHTGKLLARIDPRALNDRANITALCYSEETGDIVTGNE